MCELQLDKIHGISSCRDWILTGSIRLHFANLLNHGRAAKGERNAWRAKARNDYEIYAKTFCRKVCDLHVWDEDGPETTSGMANAYEAVKQTLASEMQIDISPLVAVLILNFSAPPLIRASVQKSLTRLTQYTLQGPHGNLGIVMSSAFSLRKGQHWLMKQGTIQQFARIGNCDVDIPGSLIFEQRADVRGDRSLNYPFRLLTATGAGLGELWKQSRTYNCL